MKTTTIPVGKVFGAKSRRNPKIGKDPVENMMQVGASVMLMLMGETIKFKVCGIKYTIKRLKEK